jgi:hypothetical protein
MKRHKNTENVRTSFCFSGIRPARRHYSELENTLQCDSLRHLVGIDIPPGLIPTQDNTTQKEWTSSKMEAASSSEKLVSTRLYSVTSQN